MKQLHEKVRGFVRINNLQTGVVVRTLDLLSELGEVAKEILLSTDYGRKNHVSSLRFEEEMGDLFFSLLCLASAGNVDLEEALVRVLDKYQKRLSRGSYFHNLGK